MAETDINSMQIPAASPAQGNVSWFTWPVVAFLLVLPALIMVATPMEYLVGSLLAYLNTLICGAAMVHFVRQRTLEGLIPVLFLIWPVLAWPVASIYFAVFCPEMGYGLISWTIRSLSGYVKLQLVFLLFLVCYVPIVCMLIRRPTTAIRMHVEAGTARRIGLLIFFCGGAAIVLNVISKIVSLPPFGVYIADGALLYMDGTLLVVGAYFMYLSKTARIWIILFLLGSGFFYTLGNARGMALRPLMLFLIGLLFCADLTQKWKITIIGILAACIPVYMVIGNTTRNLNFAVGFSNLSQRYDAITRWREVASNRSFMASTMGRMFYTGGHAMITMTPEQYPYMPFSLPQFLIEMAGRLLPGKFYFNPFYSGSGQLIRYGFRINEVTSVEVSLVGSLWALGGPAFVVAGGILTAIMHGVLAQLLRRAGQVSTHKAIFFISMLTSTIIFWPNTDFINNFRNIVWHTLAAVVVYYVLLHWIVIRENQTADLSGTAATYAPYPR